jgi:hypothetical protein
MALYTVHHWQFITEEFVSATKPMSLADAWAYVRAQIASGKDMSRFRVVEAA